MKQMLIVMSVFIAPVIFAHADKLECHSSKGWGVYRQIVGILDGEKRQLNYLEVIDDKLTIVTRDLIVEARPDCGSLSTKFPYNFDVTPSGDRGQYILQLSTIDTGWPGTFSDGNLHYCSYEATPGLPDPAIGDDAMSCSYSTNSP